MACGVLCQASAMKIIGALFPGRVAPSAKTSFTQVLQKQQVPPGLTKKPLPSAPRIPPVAMSMTRPPVAVSAHQKTAGTLTAARASAHQSVAHLQEARAAHHQVATERLDSRLIDLICKELVIEFTHEPAKSRPANQDLPLPPPTPNLPLTSTTSIAPAEAPRAIADGTVRAAAAVELIEKIETFIKDSRVPSIALTLNNSLGAKVEIERVGPREVALRLIGHHGPPPAEDIGRIRDEMAAHGLKVCALSVG